MDNVQTRISIYRRAGEFGKVCSMKTSLYLNLKTIFQTRFSPYTIAANP